MPNEWEAGATPWLRRHQPEATYGHEPNPVQCLFCGGQTVKRSSSDDDEDPGRIELYCDNGSCDAREMVLLVRRDGEKADLRADVMALRMVDEGSLDVNSAYPRKFRTYSWTEMAREVQGVRERRMREYAPPEK
ncbi:hypothetical protein KVH31_34535 [Streptomyces olivaceus]|uniref:hypothetical protein n=1 Tax=Streptomyces olivaceus TaxID=47716 RepID=UPI001CCDE4DC|nr:hypothetical protein [Streptomyces olivaceus]MBZ6211615.1 hypothetical protein [Streptomyces olivaceus]